MQCDVTLLAVTPTSLLYNVLRFRSDYMSFQLQVDCMGRNKRGDKFSSEDGVGVSVCQGKSLWNKKNGQLNLVAWNRGLNFLMCKSSHNLKPKNIQYWHKLKHIYPTKLKGTRVI